jgi:hypothetical protein
VFTGVIPWRTGDDALAIAERPHRRRWFRAKETGTLMMFVHVRSVDRAMTGDAERLILADQSVSAPQCIVMSRPDSTR